MTLQTPSDPEHLVECLALDGRTVLVPAEQLIIRPAAYALLIDSGRLLLLRSRATGKYHLPGGGVGPGERIEQALQREVREETGLELGAIHLAHFQELFFVAPSGRAYHGLHFYYRCCPASLELLPDDQVNDSFAEKPRWVAIRGLAPADFQAQGEIVLALCASYDARQEQAGPLPGCSLGAFSV